MLPVGFSLSSFSRMRQSFAARMLRRGRREVFPMHSKMLLVMNRNVGRATAAERYGIRTYGQYCSVARALDILGERWTLLVVRELLCGSTRFNDIRRGIPRISRTMLS